MNRKIIITALALLLVTSLAFASIRMLGQGPMRIGGGGISFYQNANTDYAGTYWGTARTAYWTDTRVALWATARNTELP